MGEIIAIEKDIEEGDLVTIEGRTPLFITAVVELSVKKDRERGRRIIKHGFNDAEDNFDVCQCIKYAEENSLNNTTFFFNQSYEWFDSRASSSKNNKNFGWLMDQALRQKCRVFISMTHFDMLDKRVRRAVSARLLVRPQVDNGFIYAAKIRAIDLKTGERDTLEVPINRDVHYGNSFSEIMSDLRQN